MCVALAVRIENLPAATGGRLRRVSRTAVRTVEDQVARFDDLDDFAEQLALGRMIEPFIQCSASVVWRPAGVALLGLSGV